MTDPIKRLQDELTLVVSDDARTRHLAAMTAALATTASLPTHAPVALPATARLRRRIATATAAFVVIAVPSAAMAQSALPGDRLHGVKVALERVQQFVDPDVRAEHRLAELDTLLSDETVEDDALRAALGHAQIATAGGPASPTATERLEQLRERANARLASGKPGVGPSEDHERGAGKPDAATTEDDEHPGSDRGKGQDRSKASDHPSDHPSDGPSEGASDRSDDGHGSTKPGKANKGEKADKSDRPDDDDPEDGTSDED